MRELKRIFVKGGILSPNELKQIVHYAYSLGLDSLHFGSRQDIILPSHEEINSGDLKDNAGGVTAVLDPELQNIVCSYVSADIFPSTTWLNGSTYLYILESFKHQPRIKINITDPEQRLTPLYSGELNFIASDHEDYWYLNLNLSGWDEPVFYPVLIFSWDISKISKIIEETYKDAEDADELFLLVNDIFQANNRNIEKPLNLDYIPFPYYEGMNKMGINQYWLGLYWRNNKYYLSFLDDFCDFCLENKIGKICITAWKSFIVKGIPKESKLLLEKFLGRSGINVRHSLLELNWHLPVADEEALALKKFIVMNFDQNDISTYGLTFGIANRIDPKIYFASIMIEKNKLPDIVKNFEVRSTYNVLYSEKFDQNSSNYSVYAQDVDKIELPGLLMELSKEYFNQLGETDAQEIKNEKTEVPESKEVYQCNSCMTVYDSEIGDPVHGADRGTLFEDLPSHYRCPVCNSEKESFKLSLI
ncbi:MAG: rubredoxin [Flavobacteriaceae bacterium]|nr:MAG: rubredoxin [Flavobacteriaceae bacterium]